MNIPRVGTGGCNVTTSIVDRFAGLDGTRRLRDAWLGQSMVAGNGAIADALANATTVESFNPGDEIFAQGDAGTDLYLVLIGEVQVERNSRPGPRRAAGAHFGEMTLIDVSATRSATIRASAPSVLARVTEPDFKRIADGFPELWRHLAIEIARRLRQRLADIPPTNAVPRIFIGSSSEGLKIATTLRDGLSASGRDVQLWTDNVFGASQTTIESLENAVRAADFAVLVFSPDDKLTARGTDHATPRDNVIFELGLFMGALGRHRTFVVHPREGMLVKYAGPLGGIRSIIGRKRLALKIPSDLLGLTLLPYQQSSAASLEDSLAPTCLDIIKAVNNLGPK